MTQSNKTISPLRKRMLEDMRIRGLTTGTQTGYIRAIKRLTVFGDTHGCVPAASYKFIVL